MGFCSARWACPALVYTGHNAFLWHCLQFSKKDRKFEPWISAFYHGNHICLGTLTLHKGAWLREKAKGEKELSSAPGVMQHLAHRFPIPSVGWWCFVP
jgi:hypothetical protein